MKHILQQCPSYNIKPDQEVCDWHGNYGVTWRGWDPQWLGEDGRLNPCDYADMVWQVIWNTEDKSERKMNCLNRYFHWIHTQVQVSNRGLRCNKRHMQSVIHPVFVSLMNHNRLIPYTNWRVQLCCKLMQCPHPPFLNDLRNMNVHSTFPHVLFPAFNMHKYIQIKQNWKVITLWVEKFK